MLARGLVEIRPGRYGMGAFFAAAGIAGVKALLEAYARLREELGFSPATENTEGE